MRACKSVTERGEPCRQAPITDKEFCFWHDPDSASEAAEARRMGGYRRRREKALGGAYDLEGLGSIGQLRRLLEVAVLDVLALENSIARGRTLGYMVQVGASLLEKGEMEERLAALEEAMAPRLKVVSSGCKKGRGRWR